MDKHAHAPGRRRGMRLVLAAGAVLAVGAAGRAGAERPEQKPDTRPDTKPGDKPDDRPDIKPGHRPAEKPAESPADRPAAGAADARPVLFGPQTSLGIGPQGREVLVGELLPRALVVCFWAAWCPYCRAELQMLERIQSRVPPESLRVVLVNTEAAAAWRRVRAQLQDGVSMLLTHDADGSVSRVFQAPRSVPYTVVLNRDGSVRGQLTGWGDDSLDWLVRHVNGALASQPAAR